MKVEIDDSVISEVDAVGFEPVFGVRPLKRAIQSPIENPLAKAILEGRFAGGVMGFEKGSEID